MRHQIYFFIIAILCFILSCAVVSRYIITIHYIPQKTITAQSRIKKDFIITVATFNDSRAVDDKTVIGKKVMAKNDKIVARVTAQDPAREVTRALKHFLTKAGYSVDERMPQWDLSEQAINRSWGHLVIGGIIEELEIICRSENTGVQYNSRIKLRVMFNDVTRRKILTANTIESTATLKHLRCAKAKIQEQLNTALSLALEKIAENGALDKIIQEISTVRSESLAE